MDKKNITQYERKLKKAGEDRNVLDAVDALKSCDNYELRKKYYNNLVNLLCSRGYTTETLPENPIDLNIKILIRADLDSYIPKIDSSTLSASYAKTLLKPQKEETLLKPEKSAKRFLDTDYRSSIQSSEGWKIANQFTSFQKIYKHVIKKMLSAQIDPNAVKEMTVADCMHFVSKNCKSSFREHSLKKTFVQTFIRYNQEELRKIHFLQGVDVRYTKAMVEAMENDGISCGIKVFDEKGNAIKGPEYDIHHRIPVKHAGETGYFSEVNLFKNLVLVEKDIYHKLIHLCEKSEYLANKRYFSKLLTPQNGVFISGLETTDVIYYNFESRTKTINPALQCVELPKVESAYCSHNNKAPAKNSKPRKPTYKKRGGRYG